jgi:dTDP-glucose pyrophosphorylase/predicted transcriptional regulator
VIKTQLSGLSVSSCESIRVAIERINTSFCRMVFVVNQSEKLVGTVTDGDIRRGLISGRNLDERVDLVMQAEFKAVLESSRSKAHHLMRMYGLSHIPVIDCEGRFIDLISHDANDSTHTEKQNTVVIMAGGKGVRLGQLTRDCPKPMLLVNSKPMLELILERFIYFGFYKFVFSVNYLKEQIIDYFGDGNRWGVEISYIEEPEPLGTAGSLRLMNKKSFTDPVIVANGDIITELDLDALIEFHTNGSFDATVCAKRVGGNLPFGVMKVEKDKLVEIVEKPYETHLVSAGVYVLGENIIRSLQGEGWLDMPDFINRLANDSYNLGAFLLHETWEDVGFPETLERVRNIFR